MWKYHIYYEYFDILLEHGVLWATIEALDEVLPDIGFPIDNEFELQEMSYSFSRKNNGILDGLVMVIDGLIVRTRCPYNYEVSDPKSYQHRKGGFGITHDCQSPFQADYYGGAVGGRRADCRQKYFADFFYLYYGRCGILILKTICGTLGTGWIFENIFQLTVPVFESDWWHFNHCKSWRWV